MNIAAELHAAIDRFLARHTLPAHGALLIEFRDGRVHRLELKTSAFARDLTAAQSMRHTVDK